MAVDKVDPLNPPPFAECIAWHHLGKHLSVGAPSYVRTNVIVKELDEAIRLLREFDKIPVMPDGVDEDEFKAFLAKHSAAPYG